MNEHFIIYNSQYYLSGQPVISISNRGFRFGDGLFETIRLYEGKILNADFHFERLFHGMELMQFDLPDYYSKEFFTDEIKKLLLKNSISQNARIRIMVFRGDGNGYIFENNCPDFIIETFALTDKLQLNENGLTVDIFPHSKKSCDRYSNLKTNNSLPSVMARLFAKNNHLDDAIIMNAMDRVCESSIANLFVVKGQRIYTPPLSEGCIAGTLRRWMLEKLSLNNFRVEQKKLTVEELLDADEIFLTNSIYLVKWIKFCQGRTFTNEKVKEIFQNVIQQI